MAHQVLWKLHPRKVERPLRHQESEHEGQKTGYLKKKTPSERTSSLLTKRTSMNTSSTITAPYDTVTRISSVNLFSQKLLCVCKLKKKFYICIYIYISRRILDSFNLLTKYVLPLRHTNKFKSWVWDTGYKKTKQRNCLLKRYEIQHAGLSACKLFYDGNEENHLILWLLSASPANFYRLWKL
jgi:hypothetical protein